jgi:hypothetical protein
MIDAHQHRSCKLITIARQVELFFLLLAVFIRRPPEQLAISLLLRISFFISLFCFGRLIIHSALQLKMNRYSFVALIVAVAMAAAASSNRQVVCFNNLFKFSRLLVIT